MASMKKVFIVAIVLGLTFTAIPVFAQSAKEALFGLKKLQARCQSGISYKDYSNAVADAKFPVNMFVESAEAKKFPELTDSINKVIRHYEFAGKLWNLKFSTSHGIYYIKVASELGQEIGKSYPEAVRHTPPKDPMRIPGDYYDVDDLLPHVWNTASKELDNTTKLYAKTEGETSSEIDKLKKENEQRKATAENERLKAENEQLKAVAENEKLRAENERLKKQLESLTPKKKK